MTAILIVLIVLGWATYGLQHHHSQLRRRGLAGDLIVDDRDAVRVTAELRSIADHERVA